MDFSSRDIGGFEEYYNENKDDLEKMRALRVALERRKQTGRVWRTRHENLLVRTVSRVNSLEIQELLANVRQSPEDLKSQQNATPAVKAIADSVRPTMRAEMADEEQVEKDEEWDEEKDSDEEALPATEFFLSMDHSKRILEWHQTMLNTQRRLGLATSPPHLGGMTGSGPYDEEDCVQFLDSQGKDTGDFDPADEVFVVGWDDYNDDYLMWLIKMRAGKRLKIYSQEMMAAWLSCGKDPYGNEEIMREFLDGHPALEWLAELDEYDWFGGKSLVEPSVTDRFYEIVTDSRIVAWHDQWLETHVRRGSATSPPVKIMVAGSGPLGSEECGSILNQFGISVDDNEPSLDHLVVGRNGWNEDDLLAIGQTRETGRLWVYSQEMLLAWLSCGQDPFLDRGILDAFLPGHKGLEWFNHLPKGEWTQGVLTPRSGRAQGDMPRNPSGLLTEIEYRVGMTRGVRKDIRRGYFDEFMSGTRHSSLGRVGDALEFGPPKSGTRLECLEKRIAHQIFEKRRAMEETGQDNSVALRDWQEDLDWLYEKYYRPSGFRFKWKDGAVNPWT